MPEIRVEVIGQEKFDEREWLRREVLWGSLMAPYEIQMASWFNGTAIHQHMGNFSRATLFSENELDIDHQSNKFFNQGKNIGGILSSATLFRVSMTERPRRDYEELSDHALRIQARCVDIALGNISVLGVTAPTQERLAYETCTQLAIRARSIPESAFGRKHNLLRAGKIMSALACREVTAWRETAEQNDEGTLPILTILNGGYPRSAGHRVERLQPLLEEIVSSDAYKALEKPQAAL